MAELNCKTKQNKIIRGNTIQLPNVFIEENGLDKDVSVDIYYGKNYSCVVLVPSGVNLGSITKERINKLVSEPLATER